MFTDSRSYGSAPWRLGWTAVAMAGALAWAWSVSGINALRAWQALLVNFLFFTSLAAGLTVWPAVVETCNGRWHRGVERPAASGIAFAVPSLAALVLLWLGSPSWSPWYGKVLHQGIWLHNGFIFLRDALGLALFWFLARRYLHGNRDHKNGAILILVFCLVFTLLGFDLVMGLDPEWYSTLAGGYFFISTLYIGITAWALLAACRHETAVEQRHDLGRLMVAFSLMNTYLMYSNLLPIWYENLPHEVRYVIPRMGREPWKTISYGLLATVYFGPLVLLLMQRAKRSRLMLGAISLLVLAGMWMERLWLVGPALKYAFVFGVPEIGCIAAFTGTFVVLTGRLGVPGNDR